MQPHLHGAFNTFPGRDNRRVNFEMLLRKLHWYENSKICPYDSAECVWSIDKKILIQSLPPAMRGDHRRVRLRRFDEKCVNFENTFRQFALVWKHPNSATLCGTCVIDMCKNILRYSFLPAVRGDRGPRSRLASGKASLIFRMKIATEIRRTWDDRERLWKTKSLPNRWL